MDGQHQGVQEPAAVEVRRARGGPAGEFLAGAGLLLRGLGMYARSPRLMLLGLLPAAITAVLLVGAFIGAVYVVDDVVAFLTPFADNWSSGLRDGLRTVAGVALLGAWLLISVLAYAALTLVIGEPFYEAISKSVDDRYGGIPGEIDVPFWRSLPRSILDTMRSLLLTAGFGIPLFFAGLIPVVGETIVPVLGAMVGGWVLALELTGVPFERRGLRFRHRRAMLRQHRAMTLGFGMATFMCFLVPLGAVFAMPAAVAGATLLSRRLFGQPDREP
ncbi:MAG: EI24 domain-containing protein [Micromonosporaceae bacterium]